MMPSQEEALRIKKRVPPNTTEEQRWNEVYLILFPEETGVLPSPCKFVFTSQRSSTLPCGAHPRNAAIDCHTNMRLSVYEDEQSETRLPESSKQPDASDSWLCSVSEYERYLSQSLPPRVQRELEREVQREFGFVGDAAQTRKVVDMVQKLQLRLFRQFESERAASSSSQR